MITRDFFYSRVVKEYLRAVCKSFSHKAAHIDYFARRGEYAELYLLRRGHSVRNTISEIYQIHTNRTGNRLVIIRHSNDSTK